MEASAKPQEYKIYWCQAGTSWGESSKPDLFLNFFLKVRMLRFSRHSRPKCRKSSFWEQKHCFWAFLRTEDWGLRTEDSLFTSYGWPHFHPLRPLKILKNPHKLEKSSKPSLQDCTTCATLVTSWTHLRFIWLKNCNSAGFGEKKKCSVVLDLTGGFGLKNRHVAGCIWLWGGILKL